MEYTKIKVEEYNYPKRFYRVIAVKGDPDLITLGAIIGESVGAAFEHSYMFENKKNSFVLSSWIYFDNELSLADHKMSDLGDSFLYTYDTGDNWEFKCKIYKRKVDIDVEEYEEDIPCGFILEGAGAGIFENGHPTYDDYMEGLISPELDHEVPDEFIYFPYNLDLEKFGDFDKPLDLEINEINDFGVEMTVEHMKENDAEFWEFKNNDSQYDLDDEDDDFDFIERDIKESVAYDIFNVEEVNEAFKKLAANSDIDDAYKQLVDIYLEEFEKSDDYEDGYYNFLLRVTKLLKNQYEPEKRCI